VNEQRQIYVKLTDEVVDVWRPVEAECLHGDFYKIADQPYDRETEAWEFEPGDVVLVELIKSSDGPIRAATRAHSE
jgi:hypothetical protein